MVIGIIGTVVTAGLTAWVGGFLDSVLKGVFPSGVEAACSVREAVRDRWPAARPGPTVDKFRVLIARLDLDDPDGTQTRYVTRVFRGQRGVEALETCHVLPRPAMGEAAERSALDQGRSWLGRRRADLLIWGAVWKKDEAFDLWFTSAVGEPNFQANPFRLVTSLLSDEFSKATAEQLLAVAVTAVQPADEPGKDTVDILQPVSVRLRRLIEAPPKGFGPEQLGDLHHALGLASQAIGNQSGDIQRLEEAIDAYRAALSSRTRERRRLDWSVTKTNLANTLRSLGWREGNRSRLKEAVAIHRELLDECARDCTPADRAATQGNLASALANSGLLESNPSLLREAVALNREALGGYARQSSQWATIQNNLGITLTYLGKHDGNMEQLKEAVAVLEDALSVRTRASVPLQWAQSRKNLGRALRHLGEREADQQHLEEAASALRKAIDVFEQTDAVQDRDGTRERLARVEAALAEQKKGRP